MKLKLVYIEWEDAMSQGKWMNIKDSLEWGEKGSYMIHEVGWILKETKNYLLLASLFSPADFTEQEDKWSNLQRLPKTWIHKRIDLTKYIK